jgi:phenylacetate-CoA ligase
MRLISTNQYFQMNKQFLKKIRDNIPESLKYLTAPIFRKALIKNNEFCKYYNLLECRDKLNSEKIREYQFSQLKNILIYSYQNVPYYHELFNKISFDPLKFSDIEQMQNIPFLTREIIRDNFDILISTTKVKNGYYVGTTGGSSGIPLKFFLDYDSIYKENAFIYFYRKKLGYNFNDKLATFRAIEFENKLWKFNPMHNEIIFSPVKLSKVTIASYARKINEFRPVYLNGYLSTIWYFAKLLEEYQIKLNTKLKGIFLTSENIDNKQRMFIEQFFNVKSATFYGHSERCVIADEITPGMYKFDPYYGFTEKVQLENNKYSIVGTGFLNQVMPFIRYKTDDVCSPIDQFCTIEGKRSSTVGLYGYNNEFLSSTAFDLENPIFKNITTYQFVQKEKGKADLLIIVNKYFQISEMDIVKKEIYKTTKGIIDIDIKIVDSLLLSPRGKYDMYIIGIGSR